MANTVQIIVETIDRSSNVFTKILSGLGMSDQKIAAISDKLPGLISKFSLAGAAIGAVVKATSEMIEANVKYVQGVDDLSRSIGVNREETSKLVQITQGLAISEKSVASALEYAVKHGIDVSIEGIKELSKEYEVLRTNTDKTEFLIKKFGSSGAEMGKLLEQGAAGIDRMAESVKKSTIVTDDAYEATQNYLQSQERLKDVQESLNYSVGRVAMEGWTQVLLGVNVLINGYTEEVESATTATRGFSYVNHGIPGQLDNIGKSAEALAVPFWSLSNGVWSMVTGLNSIPATVDSYVTIHYSFEGIDSRDAGEYAVPTLGDWNPDFLNPNAGRKGSGPKSKYQDAYGGWESARTPYLVGEKGPEIFVPHSAGRIIPNNQLSGGAMEFDYDRFARVIAEELQKVSR